MARKRKRTARRRRAGGGRRKSGGMWGTVALLGVGALVLTGMAKAGEDKTIEQMAEEMAANLENQLAAKGYVTVTAYKTADSETRLIRNPSGATVPQDVVETYYHFMWPTNAILKYGNFDGSWEEYKAQYEAAQAAIDSLPAA